MKNIWKWILGIVLVLAVVAGLVGAAFVAHNMMAANMNSRRVSAAVPGGTPNPQDRNGPRNGPMQRAFPGWRAPGRMPMMPGRGFSPFHGGLPFGPGFLFLGGLMRLLPLVFLAVLVVGAYLLGKRARAPVAVVAPPVVPTHACLKCGEPVQDGAKYCPSCGKKQ